MKMLTVYTPTFNRGEVLHKVYESLCKQSCKDFVWMIVDDGSTDETMYIVKNWQEEHIIDIIYFFKNNGGVHTARDFAYERTETELILGVDSDDELVENAVEYIVSAWNSRDSKEYAGILMPVMSSGGKHIGSTFPKVKSATYQDFTYKYRFKGDKQTIIRADIIKSIKKAPVFKSEKIVGETYKWIQLPEIPFILLNRYCKIVDYRDDGYSKNARFNWFRNLNGFRAEYKQHIESAKYIRPKVKGNIGYIMTSLFLKDKKFISLSPKPIETILFLPLGIVGYIYALIRWKKYM